MLKKLNLKLPWNCFNAVSCLDPKFICSTVVLKFAYLHNMLLMNYGTTLSFNVLKMHNVAVNLIFDWKLFAKLHFCWFPE